MKQYDKVLVVNSGSSSLKFMVFSMATETMLAKGLVERIGSEQANLVYQREGEAKLQQTITAENHSKALSKVCTMLADPEVGILSSLKEIDAIGHRVVHGGEDFTNSILVTEEVKKCIIKWSALAPLHNPPNLDGIIACETVFPNVPNVAVFDTAFHQSMPREAYLYAIPMNFYKEDHIRKYGFHGTSHKYVTYATAEFLKRPVEELKIITCHLGNGSSVTAVNKGKVLDTTMGLTPLPGLIMGTRSGNIDPGVIFFLARQKGLSIDEIDKLLNKKSGLAAINGINSGDMRDTVEAADAGNKEAQNALEMFGHRVALYVGGYFTLLGGADAIVFTGGIGENSARGREVIMSRLAAIGCKINKDVNDKVRGTTAIITTEDSKVPCIVLPTNEELMIARETYQVLTQE